FLAASGDMQLPGVARPLRLTPHEAASRHQTTHHAARAVAEAIAPSRIWRLAGDISHNGPRTSGDEISPAWAMAVFTGTGLGSMNSALNSGYSRWCSRKAAGKSPLSAACTRRASSAGRKFEATLTTPRAPSAMNGSV